MPMFHTPSRVARHHHAARPRLDTPRRARFYVPMSERNSVIAVVVIVILVLIVLWVYL